MRKSMKRFEVVRVFKHRSRVCVIVKMMMRTPYFSEYHNGYVSVAPRNAEKDYNCFIDRIHADELTFSGKLLHLKDKRIPDKWFFGFDSIHLWNTNNPTSQSLHSVKERTIAMADEMIEKGI